MAHIAVADIELVDGMLARALLEQTPQVCEVKLQRQVAAQPVQVRLIAAPLPVEKLMLVALEDISERRAYEQRLIAAEREVREANSRKDEFLGMLSHELRNPLTPIHNSLFVLASLGVGSPEARHARASRCQHHFGHGEVLRPSGSGRDQD